MNKPEFVYVSYIETTPEKLVLNGRTSELDEVHRS
jgi:hypothetical protein